ncbi:hypothetical protein AB6M97_10400 [Streptococcus hillyeri]|uniref:Uncharacterized protein n=1 Tax=Streptococcus hillyeri TaxID=2282420 RepID=A0A3L9DSU2_9STRE|nr:hypothetical protein [Streptococcus hillyeri]RLY03103.1 hypothetical protein EAF07_06060 [Streptococcus hillyeri]
MEIRQVSESISIYSDGQRLQVIHNLGDEFILDLKVVAEDAFNIDGQVLEVINTIEPVFKISGFCSRSGEDMHRLRWAILQFQEFEQYVNDYQADLLDWWQNPGGE